MPVTVNMAGLRITRRPTMCDCHVRFDTVTADVDHRLQWRNWVFAPARRSNELRP